MFPIPLILVEFLKVLEGFAAWAEYVSKDTVVANQCECLDVMVVDCFFGFFFIVVVGIHIDLRGVTKVVHGRSRPDRTADYSRETYGQRVRIPVVITCNRSCL